MACLNERQVHRHSACTQRPTSSRFQSAARRVCRLIRFAMTGEVAHPVEAHRAARAAIVPARRYVVSRANVRAPPSGFPDAHHQPCTRRKVPDGKKSCTSIFTTQARADLLRAFGDHERAVAKAVRRLVERQRTRACCPRQPRLVRSFNRSFGAASGACRCSRGHLTRRRR